LLAAALAGAFLGFLFRPSVPLLGQLPFNTVITRGGNLQGIDQLLKSFAEESFNYMLIGAILGAVVMFVYLKMRSPQPAPAPPTPYTPPPVAPEVPAGQTTFCTSCGTAIPGNAQFCPSCGSKRT
jgi:hypothetical protein